MAASILVLAAMLLGDAPAVAGLIPADALAVVATDDLAELTRRARTLPAAIEFSHDEWQATVEHVALLARGLTESLPPEWTRSGLDLASVERAFAALVPDGERTCCVVIGLEGRDGKPPAIDPGFLRYAGAGIEGNVLVVGTRAAALDRARAVVRGEAASLATAPRFVDRLDAWTPPADGIWAWSDRDALVDAQSRGMLDLGPFIALVEQRLGHAYAWTLAIVDDETSEPTIATTTWIARVPGNDDARPPFDRSILRIVPKGALWFQTLHWDPSHGVDAFAGAARRGGVIDLLRYANTTSLEFPFGTSVTTVLMQLQKPIEDLASDPNAFATQWPDLAAVLRSMRPPLVSMWTWGTIPRPVLCVRVDESMTLQAAASALVPGVKTTHMTWAGIDVELADGFEFTIVDGWLVSSFMGGVTDVIDRSRAKIRGIEDDSRFRASFDRLVAADEHVLDVAYCDAPSILAKIEDFVLDMLMAWSRYGTYQVDAFAVPVFEGLPDVAPASVGVSRTTSHGFRIDRIGFLGGELTGVDGVVGILAGLVPILERQAEVEKTMTGVQTELNRLARTVTLYRNVRGQWPTIDDLAPMRGVPDDTLHDPWDAAYGIEVLDERRCRLFCLGADQFVGGTGLDADVERIVILKR